MCIIIVRYIHTCSENCVCSVVQSCPALCDPIDCSQPGSSVHGSLQARILEWVAIPFSRGLSPPRDPTHVSCITGWLFTIWATRKAHIVRDQFKKCFYLKKKKNQFIQKWVNFCCSILNYPNDLILFLAVFWGTCYLRNYHWGWERGPKKVGLLISPPNTNQSSHSFMCSKYGGPE